MNLSTLYSRTSTGAIQTWTVEVEGGKHRVTSGQIDGKKTTTEWTVCEPKNIGRSNETSAQDQALLEAQAKWKKKCEADYREEISEIDAKQFVEPMLAKNFEDYDDGLKYPLFSQPKYDGIRCVVTDSITMKTRSGKIIISAPHIGKALEAFFLEFPDVILDGELYCDKLANDFNKICSLVKKAKPTSDELDESRDAIQYWVYDIVNTKMPFKDRSTFLQDHLPAGNTIRLVPTETVSSRRQLDELYEGYMASGYEGQMVRLNSVYELKRSKSLLKRKEFMDDEFVIKDIIEGDGNKAGMAASMLFETTGSKPFNSNIKGDRDYLRMLLSNTGSLIGKTATVKYFNLTPDGIPRFPYVIGIRDYE